MRCVPRISNLPTIGETNIRDQRSVSFWRYAKLGAYISSGAMDCNSTEIKYPREATIFASACAILFCVLGVIGNLVTVLALVRCQKLRKHATTYFVLSLCISDFLFCAFNLPLTASRYIHEAWTLGETLCQLFPVLFYGNVAVSLLNMTAITINRYVLISCHQRYTQLYTTVSIWVQLLCVWGGALLVMLPPLLGIWGQLGLDCATFSCTVLEKDGNSPKKMIFLFGFCLPCIIIIGSYSCIFWKVQKSRRKLRKHELPSSKGRTSRREQDDSRLTKLMLLIFVCFLFCFLPLMLVNVFDDKVQYPILSVLASILAWASSVINPFIYAASNRQYREAYSNLFNIMKVNAVFSESRQSANSLRSRATDRNGGVSAKQNSVNC